MLSLFRTLSPGRKRLFWVSVIVLGTVVAWALIQASQNNRAGQQAVVDARIEPNKAANAKPALTVTAILPQVAEWPHVLETSGTIVAWQEAVISTEASNLILTEVRVNVGDQVKQGQVLARIANDTVKAEWSEAQASVAEAEAMLGEARANGDRARQYQQTGFLSAQMINQYLTAEKTAVARLNAARARMQSAQLRLAQTLVRAPDDGVISARTATPGSLAQPGHELFRLIRGGRLEWRAEVNADDLGKLQPGRLAVLTTPEGVRVQGRVRMVAPTVNPQTLNGLVYVDLPASETGNRLRAGMFARGVFELGRARAVSLPQSAVVLRDGFSYVFRIGDVARNGQAQVSQVKVAIGQRRGDQIEIRGGLEPDSWVVASGAGFLVDGDSVRVLEAPAAPGQKR
ncbi:MAG TPA: efflux RND transporter periplasmic adaptor subunit [Thiobacillus sp.]|nr:MAG: hypothetical protein B7Y50_14290 [Hydrogenophilales bacterium 28-61-11]OYZ56574.1 MAG: hypothetical protein B7Y21_10965 [Hydrogenophilales bacterium 16-61-112]OZA45680.1 MAG: hypothetical protein B7X81_07905 [Hydrogenophilales bacterium 17-61-76]HQT31920.1 efflux RND transporter periplasmic adaptor subunit [Thiobacillus sp.]HQT71490.1 efflux RND transporter periplasmic adaptor subunit [Thiobacillus sp.]